MIRPTVLGFVAPRLFTEDVGEVDVETFSEFFEWRQDRFGGLLDTIKPPTETLLDGRGDCEDFAWVVLSSWLSLDRRQTVAVVSVWDFERMVGHVVVWDGEWVVGSDGRFRTNPREYARENGYDVGAIRYVRGGSGFELFRV